VYYATRTLKPSYRLYYHFVIVTKFRTNVFNRNNSNKIEKIIRHKCIEKECYIKQISIWKDHVHLLISLKPNNNLSKLIQEIKGYSSYKFNIELNLKGEEKLVWQRGYSVDTVSNFAVPKIKAYISNQENHHSKQGQA